MHLGIKNLGKLPLPLSAKAWNMVLTPDIGIDVGNQSGDVWILGRKPSWYEQALDFLMKSPTVPVRAQIMNKSTSAVLMILGRQHLHVTLMPGVIETFEAPGWIEIREMRDDPFMD